ncbi:hypothetical protein PsYK624_044200 [Phanerochaete sordida]|uniref:Uncharacterized protein n=1 Tax=Phanerochaete sordida TaxID=48140 RepID=A0A9P3G589_9APHY|nr:hypothetical protein PsYK624_044200 [Phanerochaete sordida]
MHDVAPAAPADARSMAEHHYHLGPLVGLRECVHGPVDVVVAANVSLYADAMTLGMTRDVGSFYLGFWTNSFGASGSVLVDVVPATCAAAQGEGCVQSWGALTNKPNDRESSQAGREAE